MLKSLLVFVTGLLLVNVNAKVKVNHNPHYVCTSLKDDTDYYTYNKNMQFNFPQSWTQISTNNTCTYDCEPCYPYVVDNKVYNIGYHAHCRMTEIESQKLGLYDDTEISPKQIIKLPLENIYSVPWLRWAFLGSAVIIPSTSVQISIRSASSAAPIIDAV